MGQAKRRGTYEERQTQAIEAGRLKYRMTKTELEGLVRSKIRQRLGVDPLLFLPYEYRRGPK